MRIVHLPPGPISEDLQAVLRLGRVYLSLPEPQVIAAMREIGIEVEIAGAEIPGDATLVIVNRPLDELAAVVDRLLGPDGCPWDRAQTHESLKKYLLEEAYEVLDAIDEGSNEKLREELGDLLLQPVLHAQMEKAAGSFDIDDVAREITDKLIRRHPHVFGDVAVEDADEVLRNWDRIKQGEKGEEPQSILAGLPRGMASLLRAHEMSKRVARVGFEWPSLNAVLDKLHEEERELLEAIGSGDQKRIESEIGDVLFTIVNIARWLKVEPEEALRKMLNRFSARFMHMEAMAGRQLSDLSAEEWDALWGKAKSEKG